MADKKLRILRIADVVNNRTGGMSRAMYLTADYMQQQGHAVDFLFAESMPPSRPTLRRFTTPLFIRRYVREAIRGGKNWDVIEVHEPSGAFLCAARKSDRRIPPIVAYSHGIEERGWKAEIDYRAKSGLPVTLKNRYSPLSVILQANYALQHADHRLVTNTDDRAYIMQRWKAPQDSITIVQTGITPSYISAGEALRQKGWDDARYNRILFLATWILRKGTRELTLAMNRLLQERPQISLTIAGCGVPEEEVRSGFIPEVQSQIHVLPKVNGDDALQDLYARHGIFLLPSFFEGQPLVMVEAAAMHAALVMTNICGMKDFLKDGSNGVTIPVGDADALHAAITGLINDPSRARRLGEHAHALASTCTWEETANAVLAAYRAAQGGVRS